MTFDQKHWDQTYAGWSMLYVGGCRGSRGALTQACATWEPLAPGGFTYHSKDFSRYGGETTSLGLVFFGNRPEETTWVIIDQGTGVIAMSERFIIPSMRTVRNWVGSQTLNVTCLQTHFHGDHVTSFTFNKVFNEKNVKVTYCSPDLRLYKKKESSSMFKDTPASEKMMRNVFSEDMFPLPYEALDAEITHQQFTVGKTLTIGPDIKVITHPLWHPGGCSGFIITREGYQSFLCMTDCDLGSDPNLGATHAWMKQADSPVMYVDMQYLDEQYRGEAPTGDGSQLPRYRSGNHPGWGHNCPGKVLRTLCDSQCQPSQVIWGHHDPNNDDATLDQFQYRIWEQAAKHGLPTTIFQGARDSGKTRCELKKLT